jgi:FtsH-binding integral membrane protein
MSVQQFINLISKKRELLTCIFSTLIFQLLITSAVVYYLFDRDRREKNSMFQKMQKNKFNSLFFILISIGLIIFMMNAEISFFFKSIFFTFFSIVTGFLFSTFIYYFSEETIKTSLISTMIIYLFFLFFGYLITSVGANISNMGAGLLLSLLGLIIVRIVLLFNPSASPLYKFINVISLVIFSLYILFDTNNILLRFQNTKHDCIQGALSYYLDIINIFSSNLNFINN